MHANRYSLAVAIFVGLTVLCLYWAVLATGPASQLLPSASGGEVLAGNKGDRSPIVEQEIAEGPEPIESRAQVVEIGDELGIPPTAPALELTESDRWALKYREFSGPDMHYQRNVLKNDLGTQVLRITSELFDAGFYEVIGIGDVPPAEEYQTGDRLVAFRSGPDGRHLKVVIDEGTHPDLYALRREVQWLHDQGRLAILAKGLPLLPRSQGTTGSVLSSSQIVDDR